MDKLYELIYDCLDRQDWAAAKEHILKLKQYEPEDAARLLVSLYIESDDIEGAKWAWAKLHILLPKDFYTHFLYARILFMEKLYVSAYEELKKLRIPVDKRQGYGEKIANLLGQCCRILGKTEEAADSYKQAAEWAAEPSLQALEYSNYLFNLHYGKHKNAYQLHQAAADYGRIWAKITPFVHMWHREPGRRLRIGYISSDLRKHVVLCFCYALLAHYDRQRFAVFAYMLGEEDEYSRLLQKKVDCWRNLRGLTAQEAAQIIHDDEIDILVDLAGHTKGNGLPVLAYKPAPIQISGIGYFASTGLQMVDYFLGDIYLDGKKGEKSRTEFTEELVIMPHSHFCYSPFYVCPLPNEKAWQRTGYVTFGSFNNFAKVTDEVLAVWGRILQAVPDSRLLLKAAVFDGGELEDYTKKRLKKAELPLDRVECRGISENYLAEYADMDIALDTFPYPGGGTSCDALYMGVPLVTLEGSSHGGRFGYSLLMNLGLGELSACSVEEYVEKAVALAHNKELLLALQQNLRSIMEKSPLMDGELYLTEVQAAYEQMANRQDTEQHTLTYREKIVEQKITDDIIQALDRGAADKAGKLLSKLKFHDAVYCYLCSELAALQTDFAGSDAFCMQAKTLPRAEESWLQGALYNRQAENAKQTGRRRLAADYFRMAASYKDMAQGKAAAYSNFLFNLHYSTVPDAEMLAAARGYGEMFASAWQYRHTGRRRKRKLRVGYISPDFCRHIVACFCQAFFRMFNADRFEVFAYADCEPDDVTEQLRRYSVTWRQINGMPAADKAALIYRDGIDILVDLSGHTGHSALPVLACKPAPVQISGIGYFATTGLGAVDYYLTDKYTALPGEEAFFTERLLRLPHSHLCYKPIKEREPLSLIAPCSCNSYVTLGTMNNFDKMTPDMLSLWAEIMNRLPDARLLLKSGAFDKKYRVRDVWRQLQQAGIEPERTELQGYTEDYWRFYEQIDIALDTYPYTGGGSTCDALYMGVPVVSLYGKHHHQRFGYSLLQNAGLGELAVDGGEAYVQKVVELASDRTALADLHKIVAEKFRKSPVMDEQGYMAVMENIYQQIGG